MPIEIREVIIKATVTSENGSEGSGSNNGGKTNDAELIHLCVEKVMEILKEKNER